MFDKYRANGITRIYMEKYAHLKELMKIRNEKLRITDDLLNVDSMLNVYIEPTNRCNLNCIFCARENMKRDFDMLDFEAFQKTIDSLPKGTYLTLTGNGEPTLNVRIYDMISYAAEKGMFVSIITNGCTLNEKNRKKLIESGISRIQISFQALDKEVDEAIMQGVVYERELLNILKLIYEIRTSRKNIFISITKVDIEESRSSAEITKKFWEKMPIDNYYEGRYLSLQTDSGKYKEENEEIYLPCADPWITVKVNANGDVNPCPQDFSNKYVIGNINKDSLGSLLNSEKAKKFRMASLTGDMDFLNDIGYCCKNCNTWRKTGGGYSIEDCMQCALPIRMGLVIDEISGNKPTHIQFLIKAINVLETGKADSLVDLVEKENV